MSNNILSFPRAPQYVIPECTYRGSMYHRHSGMGLAGIQENVIPMSVSEEKSNVFPINHQLGTINWSFTINHKLFTINQLHGGF